MIKVLFYPPIADKHRVAECAVSATGVMTVADLIALLKSRHDLAGHFASIASYGGFSDPFASAIFFVNGTDAGQTTPVRSGDIVKVIMPLAGG